MVLTRKEKMADAIASRLRYSKMKAVRKGTSVCVYGLTDSEWSKLNKMHKVGLFKDVKLVRK